MNDRNNKKNKPAKTGVSYNAVIESIDKSTGRVIKRETIHNMIVNNGLERIARLLGNESLSGFEYIALGTDATAVTINDTSLGTEVERELATTAYVATNQMRFSKIFSVGSGVSYNIREVGVFDSAVESGSVMWARLNNNNTLDSDTDLSVTITYLFAEA